MWVDKGGVLLRENETKVVITIGNYLNNSEGSGKADGELTNPCTRGTHHSVTIMTDTKERKEKEKKVEEIMIVGDVGSQIKPLNTIQKAKSSWIILEKFAYLAEDIPEVG